MELNKLFNEIEKNGEVKLGLGEIDLLVMVNVNNINVEKIKEEVDNLEEEDLLSYLNDNIEINGLVKKLDLIKIPNNLLESLIDGVIEKGELEFEEEISELKNLRDINIGEYFKKVWEFCDNHQPIITTLKIKNIKNNLISFEYFYGE